MNIPWKNMHQLIALYSELYQKYSFCIGLIKKLAAGHCETHMSLAEYMAEAKELLKQIGEE